MSIEQEFEKRFKSFARNLPENVTQEWVHPSLRQNGEKDELLKWIRDTFPRYFASRSPKGSKIAKRALENLIWSIGAETDPRTLGSRWVTFKSHLEDVVKFFTATSKTQEIPESIKVGNNTYKNLRGFSEKTAMKYVKIIETILKSLKGWRKHALRGGVTFALAGPKQFRGTAGGRYNVESDTMFIRATPSVVKRAGGSYGSFEYILIHELGHRYEYKKGVPSELKHAGYGENSWYTTKYSRSSGVFGSEEYFAELFALGHFDITMVHGDEFESTVQKFENLMLGKDIRDIADRIER